MQCNVQYWYVYNCSSSQVLRRTFFDHQNVSHEKLKIEANARQEFGSHDDTCFFFESLLCLCWLAHISPFATGVQARKMFLFAVILKGSSFQFLFSTSSTEWLS